MTRWLALFTVVALAPAFTTACGSDSGGDGLFGLSMAVDIEGTARPQGGAVDRGAHEK